jgi:large subunit ribosomal protein L4
MSAIVLNDKYEEASKVALPESYKGINPHNVWLYVKSYQAGLRANTAMTKTRGNVSGGGKKPFAQKGGGRARAGSTRSPIWVGGGTTFGPSNNRNYVQKINKKQKKVALNCAINALAENGKLFIVDSISVESGKTKDAMAIFNKLGQRDVLLVKELIDDKTFLAFRNIDKSYLIEGNELNAYLAATFRSVVIEKAVYDKLVEGA